MDYCIEFDTEILEALNLYGRCESKNLKIRINHDNPISRQQLTLLHELIHAIDVEVFDGDDPISLKETQVKALAMGLYQVMRQNPSLIKWIWP